MSADFKYFPQIFKEVVDEVRKDYDPTNNLLPYFEYGTYLELLQQCKIKDNNQIAKYPLIWLVWDQNENTGKWIDPYIFTISPRVFICTLTDLEYTTEQRYTNTLETVLYPIFDFLSDEVEHHKNISFPLGSTYPVNDHPFWLNSAEVHFDVLSAIEIKFENLLMYKTEK